MTTRTQSPNDREQSIVALSATNVGITLGGKAVLRDVDFRANSGEIVGLIGPNGAGKTTLLRILAGVLAPDRGHVQLRGRSLAEMDTRARGQHIAYQPQDRTIHWPVSVRALVELGRLPYQTFGKSPSSDDRAAVARALLHMKLDDLSDRAIDTLSGGEQARVLIARALAQEADVLIADEPVAGLDPAHQLRLFEHLQQFADRGGCVIVALHDLTLAARFCHHLVLMSEGRSVANGKPGEVLSKERIRDVYGVEVWQGETAGVPVVLPVSVSADREHL